MISVQGIASGPTLAEVQGFTQALGRAAARVGARALAAGQLSLARAILEGLAVTNPHDPAPWALLAEAERRRGRLVAARVCAETALRLAPEDLQVRLVLAEVLLAWPGEGRRGRSVLDPLARAEGAVGKRARALVAALRR